MSKLKSKTLPSAPFQVGDKVRVNHGFMDVDYPDMPLGGWAGTVTEVQGADRGAPESILSGFAGDQ